jgi:predicted HD superfamily hydrolase involved in NAD metabolism
MGSFPESLRSQILKWLDANVPQSRLHHILRVEQMAIALAEVHGESVAQAAQAGLMHDLAKYFKPQRLLSLAKAAKLHLDPVDEANPHLLHADVGALIAHEQFGVSDSDVLEAIANHTLGRPGMSRLSCIIYLADSLEPGRGDTAELQTLRQVSKTDLIRATWLACDHSIATLMQGRRMIHPRALLTRNWFLQETLKRGVVGRVSSASVTTHG